jgi:hypothetical protein
VTAAKITIQCHLPPLPMSDIEYDKVMIYGSRAGLAMGVAEASSADPEYESRIQAALADVANGTHKRQTFRDRSKGLHVPCGDFNFFLSHNSS